MHVAKSHKDIKCFSCEIDSKVFAELSSNVGDIQNIKTYNLGAIDFLSKVLDQDFKKPPVFWIDAHGYGFKWPLKEEIKLITKKLNSSFILIDDFKVPKKPEFGYDEYDGQVCSLDYIRSSFESKGTYHIFYPNYRGKTSNHHPLRGWCLILHGIEDENLISEIKNYPEGYLHEVVKSNS